MTYHEIEKLRSKIKGLETAKRLLQLFFVIVPVILLLAANLPSSIFSLAVLLTILLMIRKQIVRDSEELFSLFAHEIIWTVKRNKDVWYLLCKNVSVQGDVRLDAETAKMIFTKMSAFSESTLRDALFFFDQIHLRIEEDSLSISFVTRTITERIVGES